MSCDNFTHVSNVFWLFSPQHPLVPVPSLSTHTHPDTYRSLSGILDSWFCDPFSLTRAICMTIGHYYLLDPNGVTQLRTMTSPSFKLWVANSSAMRNGPSEFLFLACLNILEQTQCRHPYKMGCKIYVTFDF